MTVHRSFSELRHFEPSRIRISMRSLLIHRLIALFDEMRLRRAGVPKKAAQKALRKAAAIRFYRRVVWPQMEALIADMARQERS